MGLFGNRLLRPCVAVRHKLNTGYICMGGKFEVISILRNKPSVPTTSGRKEGSCALSLSLDLLLLLLGSPSDDRLSWPLSANLELVVVSTPDVT